MTTPVEAASTHHNSATGANDDVVVFTVEQVAGILQINPASVILATRNGDLPYRAFGKGPKSWRYTVSDMNAYVEGRARKGVGPRWAGSETPRVMKAPKVRRD